MFTRALIVLLLVLNVGVAAWWLTRSEPSPPVEAEPALGIARLQLPNEGARPPARAAPPADAVPAAIPAVTAASAPPQCHSFGPYRNDQLAVAAQARLQPLVLRIAARVQRSKPARGWQVALPPLASPELANATAQRIAEAGFTDYFVVRDGAAVNSIALGRYGGEDAARRRAAALVAAGFPARAEPLGGGPDITWIDVTAADGFDAERARTIAAAPERRDLDCATLR